ncbi:MAG: hypothetical protein AAF215_31990 [Cyanobacteria bacterium P01_A01_bin.123]
MQYPLELTFKFWSLAPQMSVKDANENTLFYIRQKLFKLKEAIGIFADAQRSQLLYEIKADRIIDFSARYHFLDAQRGDIGSVKRHGLRSIWRARYDIYDGNDVVFTIHEENPWIKLMDSVFAEIPIVGLFTGYVFNPAFLVQRPDESIVMRLSKRPTFMSRIFNIKQIDHLTEREETQVLLSLMMMLLLERNRG